MPHGGRVLTPGRERRGPRGLREADRAAAGSPNRACLRPSRLPTRMKSEWGGRLWAGAVPTRLAAPGAPGPDGGPEVPPRLHRVCRLGRVPAGGPRPAQEPGPSVRPSVRPSRRFSWTTWPLPLSEGRGPGPGRDATPGQWRGAESTRDVCNCPAPQPKLCLRVPGAQCFLPSTQRSLGPCSGGPVWCGAGVEPTPI